MLVYGTVYHVYPRDKPVFARSENSDLITADEIKRIYNTFSIYDPKVHGHIKDEYIWTDQLVETTKAFYDILRHSLDTEYSPGKFLYRAIRLYHFYAQDHLGSGIVEIKQELPDRTKRPIMQPNPFNVHLYIGWFTQHHRLLITLYKSTITQYYTYHCLVHEPYDLSIRTRPEFYLPLKPLSEWPLSECYRKLIDVFEREKIHDLISGYHKHISVMVKDTLSHILFPIFNENRLSQATVEKCLLIYSRNYLLLGPYEMMFGENFPHVMLFYHSIFIAQQS